MTAGADVIAREYVAAAMPFTVRRTVDWSECDPAGVVYAGNYVEYFFSAMRLFRRHGLNEPIGAPGAVSEFDTPGKAVNVVFMGPLWPYDAFDIRIYTNAPRTSTIDIFAHAVRCDDGSSVFVGRTTSICVSSSDRRKVVPVPEGFRAKIESYREKSGFPDVLKQVEHRA